MARYSAFSKMAGAENEDVVLNKTHVDVHELLMNTRHKFIESTSLSESSVELRLNATQHEINA